MDSTMALGLTEQALYYKIEVTLPSGRVVPFSFPLRVTVDKIKTEIFSTCPELDTFSKLDYTLGLSSDERLEIEFIKFMHAHPKIESAISSDEVIRLQLYIKNKEKRSESISLSTTPLHHHVRRQDSNNGTMRVSSPIAIPTLQFNKPTSPVEDKRKMVEKLHSIYSSTPVLPTLPLTAALNKEKPKEAPSSLPLKSTMRKVTSLDLPERARSGSGHRREPSDSFFKSLFAGTLTPRRRSEDTSPTQYLTLHEKTNNFLRRPSYEEKGISFDLARLDKEFEALRKYHFQPVDLAPLQSAAEGFKIEINNPEAFGLDPRNFMVDQEDNDIPFYRLHFLGKEHINILCSMPEHVGPIIVSAVKYDDQSESAMYKVLVRTKKGVQRKLVDLPKKKPSPKEVLQAIDPEFAETAISIRQIKDSKLQKELENYEERQLVKSYKFGVLYCAPGQTHENDMFANSSGSPAYEEFLEFLGEKIDLMNWKKYRAGLDVSSSVTTGQNSVYTTYRGYEVMFHVSTCLPYYENDKQQLERKRHLGNDICVIIFKDGDTPYSPDTIKSEFNQVFLVVSKVASTDGVTRYRVSVSCKEGVPVCIPALPQPCIFEKSDYFREFLFCKLVNAERSSYKSPGFRIKIERTRLTLLQDMDEEFQ